MSEVKPLIWALVAVAAAVLMVGIAVPFLAAPPIGPGFFGGFCPMCLWAMGPWMMWGWGWGFGMGLLGLLVFLSFIALLVFGVYYLVKSLGEVRPLVSAEDRAIEILRERYAKGEITREQFLTMREELKRHSP